MNSRVDDLDDLGLVQPLENADPYISEHPRFAEGVPREITATGLSDTDFVQLVAGSLLDGLEAVLRVAFAMPDTVYLRTVVAAARASDFSLTVA